MNRSATDLLVSAFCVIVFAVVFPSRHAKADAMCSGGGEEDIIVSQIISGIQQHAHKVTSTGKFVLLKDQTGEGEPVTKYLIAFNDQGKNVFTFTAKSKALYSFGFRPAITQTGWPAFLLGFHQGNRGVCEYVVGVRAGKFASRSLGYRGR